MELPEARLERLGPEALSDAELLALLWRTGTRTLTAEHLAREALAATGGLRLLLSLSCAELRRLPGIGPARAARVGAVMELARRNLLAGISPRSLLEDPVSTKRYFLAWLRDRRHEVFAGLFLDNRHRVIQCQALSTGTIDGASVYPREVVHRCLELRAAAVIFAHNHPSGIAEPSDADRHMTRRLRDALALIDVRVLDHVVVGEGVVVSMAERGLM